MGPPFNGGNQPRYKCMGYCFEGFSLNNISARSLGWCHIMTYSPLLKEPFGEAPFIIKPSVMA